MKLLALVQPDSAALGADDSRGHGAFQAERIAQGQHPIADFGVIAVAQLGGREVIGALDPQHGQVGLGIGVDLGGLELAAVVQADRDLAAVADDVGVGEDHSRGIDDQPGAQAALRRAGASRGMFLKNFRSSGMLPNGSPSANRHRPASGLPASRAWPTSLLIITTAGCTALTASRKPCDSARAGAAAGILARTGHDRANARQRCREHQPAHHRHDDGPKRPPIPHITFQKTHHTLSSQDTVRGAVQDALDGCRPQVEN